MELPITRTYCQISNSEDWAAKIGTVVKVRAGRDIMGAHDLSVTDEWDSNIHVAYAGLYER